MTATGEAGYCLIVRLRASGGRRRGRLLCCNQQRLSGDMRLTCFKTLVVVLISNLITYERSHRRNTCRADYFPGRHEVPACRVGTSSSEQGTTGASHAITGGT